MSTEESAFEPGPEAEEALSPDDVHAEADDEAYAAAGSEAGPAEPESQQQDTQTPWIAGGIIVAVLVALTCCLLVIAATLLGKGSGSGGDTVPTLPPLQLPTATPAAPDLASPTPTPKGDIQPTPTSAVSSQAAINAPSQAAVGERVVFDGSQSQPGTSPIARYDWDFGDGNKGSGKTVRYVYQTAGNYTVTLTVTDQDGLTDTAPAQIAIVSEATAEPTATSEPTATPEPTTTPLPAPVIDDFEVTPEEIQVGQCVKVSWSASGGTSWVNVLRNDDYIWENAPVTGSLQDCPDKSGDYRYRVVAWNEVDDRVREDQMVTVTKAQ